MINFLIWYLIINLLGWISFPIAHRFLPALPSKGYSFTKILGLLLWGFIFWFLTSIGLLTNNLSGQLFALAILIGLSIWSGWHDRFKNLMLWIKENFKLILIVETLFLITFGLWSLVRSANPAIIGTEKPMELAFINAILKSPTFPPHDPWLSGYAISYYYFGYVIIAMLIRFSGVVSGVGYNLSASLWFALTAISAYGVVFDLVKARWLYKHEADSISKYPTVLYFAPLLAPFLILVVSNLHGFLDILHSRGIFWSNPENGIRSSKFWQWVNLKELNTAPIEPFSWLPKRLGGVQWWGASRVLQDFRLNYEAVEVIDEFPFFSYLLSDLHPHVLAMPFVIMVIGQALNVFLNGVSGSFKAFRKKIPFSLPGLLILTVSLGGLAFLNTWDFPFYLALVSAAYMMKQVLSDGWKARRLWEFAGMMIALGGAALLLYGQFFLSFGSQAGGIYPSLIFFTRGVYFWIMFAVFLVPILGFLIIEWLRHKAGRVIALAMLITLGFMGTLFVITWLVSFIVGQYTEIGPQFLWLQGAGEVGILALLFEAFRRRLADPFTWITLAVMMFFCIGLLFSKKHSRSFDSQLLQRIKLINKQTVFVVLLILWGVLLILGPEFVYLKDQFSVRMNTIFKFYFQAWILWGLASSYAIIIIWRKSDPWGLLSKVIYSIAGMSGLIFILFTIMPELNKITLRSDYSKFGAYVQDWLLLVIGLSLISLIIIALIGKTWKNILRIAIIATVGLGLIYPTISLWNKTNGFTPYKKLTLDGTAYFKDVSPELMEAVDWLAEAPFGVLVEAVSPTGGSYSGYARVSTLTGMPTVLGWIGHVLQWRGGGDEMGSRQADVKIIYSSSSWEDTLSIIHMYNIRYIYVGDLELTTYAVNQSKFDENLNIVFQNSGVTIYEVAHNNAN